MQKILQLGVNTRFQKGHIPFSRGTKGILKSNITSFKKGMTPWNKKEWLNETILCKCGCNNNLVRFDSRHRERLYIKGHNASIEKPRSVSQMEHTKQLKEINKGRCPWNKNKSLELLRGENHWNWKGGITPLNRVIRNSIDMKVWRRKVFERDNYTCQECKQIGGKLNADHIKGFADYSELRFDLSNGRTLCEDCHRKTDNFGFKGMWKFKLNII